VGKLAAGWLAVGKLAAGWLAVGKLAGKLRGPARVKLKEGWSQAGLMPVRA
jgi:hypothetical protein